MEILKKVRKELFLFAKLELKRSRHSIFMQIYSQASTSQLAIFLSFLENSMPTNKTVLAVFL